MIGFCPLASGSKGNALYFGSPGAKILIDAGISFTDLTRRLASIGVEPSQLDAVIITHEHDDHIRGLSVLLNRCNIPVFANLETAKAIVSAIKTVPRFKIFSTGDPFRLADLSIHPFGIPHDAVDPVAFTFTLDSLKLGVCADLGFAATGITKRLEECDYLYLEANHEPSMVHACARPPVYKQRVLGRQGHLSNQECADTLAAVHHSGLKHVYLAHLSSECNHPELALKIVKETLEKEKKSLSVSIAFQDKPATAVQF